MKENTPRGFYAQWLVMSNRITSYFTYRYPSRQDELILNANFVRCPHRIGNSILIYGRKNTHFPYQAFVRASFDSLLELSHDDSFFYRWDLTGTACASPTYL